MFNSNNGHKLIVLGGVVVVILLLILSVTVNRLQPTEVQHWEGVGEVLFSHTTFFPDERGFPSHQARDEEMATDLIYIRFVVNAVQPDQLYVDVGDGYILAPTLTELSADLAGQLIVYRGSNIIGAVTFQHISEFSERLSEILASDMPIIELLPQPGSDYLFSSDIFCRPSDVEGLNCSIGGLLVNHLEAVYMIGDYCYLYTSEAIHAHDSSLVRGPLFIPTNCRIMVRYPSFLPEVPEYFR